MKWAFLKWGILGNYFLKWGILGVGGGVRHEMGAFMKWGILGVRWNIRQGFLEIVEFVFSTWRQCLQYRTKKTEKSCRSNMTQTKSRRNPPKEGKAQRQAQRLSGSAAQRLSGSAAQAPEKKTHMKQHIRHTKKTERTSLSEPSPMLSGCSAQAES